MIDVSIHSILGWDVRGSIKVIKILRSCRYLMKRACLDHSGPDPGPPSLMGQTWIWSWYSSFNTRHKDRSVATAFFWFSFYLKSNAENQILQGQTNQKETPQKKNIYRGFDISSTSIRTSPRASATSPRCARGCLRSATQMETVPHPSSHHNQPLCFRKLLEFFGVFFFFFYISVKIWRYFLW